MLRSIPNTDFVAIACLLALVLLASAKLNNSKRFNSFLQVLLDSRYFVIYNREKRVFDVFNTLLLVNTSLITATVLFHLNLVSFGSTAFTISLLTVAFFLFFSLKFWIERGLNSFFKLKKSIIDGIELKITYLNSFGVTLGLFLVLDVYTALSPIILTTIFLLFTAFVILQRLLLFFKRNAKWLKRRPYYYILYLCTLEIAPYFILYGVWLQCFK